MAKLYIDYNSVNSKTGDLAFYIQNYEKCINESCYNLQKTDYCWHDKNQEVFVNCVKKMKYDIYEQIKLLKKYASFINTFYNDVRSTIINNFDYNYVTKIIYDTDYANKAIEALNSVIKRLDWINREMPSCIVPSDYPYKKLIDSITGTTFPYCNDVVRFNSKIAFVNSRIINSLNDFYYNFRNIKTVSIEKNRLSHHYQLFSPNLDKINIENVDSVNSKEYKQTDIDIDNNLINPDVEKVKESDNEIEKIVTDDNYTDLIFDKENTKTYEQTGINISNDYDDSDKNKYYASKHNDNSLDFEKNFVNVQNNVQHSNNNDASTINFQNMKTEFSTSNKNASKINPTIDNFQKTNSLDVNQVSAAGIESTIDNFQKANSLDVNQVSAAGIKSTIDNLKNSDSLDVNNKVDV